MKKIAILLGTSNAHGNTYSLVNVIAKKTGATVFNLADYTISPFDYEHKNIDDDFIPLVEKLLKFEHIIFASPVYWYTMSAQMKVFFDRISDLLHVKQELGRKLRGKVGTVIATGSSPEPERSFEEIFISSFNYLGIKYKGMLYCYCETKFDIKEHQKYIYTQLEKIL